MKNYDKPWIEEGDFGPRIITDSLGFYFDSYDLYNTLNKHSKPELYDCYDKGDEFGCDIRFENIEHLKDFFKHLTDNVAVYVSSKSVHTLSLTLKL